MGLFIREPDGWRAIQVALTAEGMKIPPVPAADGALWFASSMGNDVYRVDGEIPTRFPDTNEPVDSIALDRDGNAYAGTYSGLEVFLEDHWERIDLGRDVGRPSISRILFTRDGSCWLGTREGLVHGSVPSWKRFEYLIGGDSIQALVAPPKGEPVRLAVSKEQRLLRLEDDDWVVANAMPPHEYTHLYYIGRHSDSIWALSQQFLYEFSPSGTEQFRQIPVEELGAPLYVRRYVEVSPNRIWLTSGAGVWEHDTGGWKPIPEFEGYQRRQTFNVLETAPGHFWAALENGIEQWTPEGAIYYGYDHGIEEEDHVHAICPASDGSVWFGSYGSGAYRLYEGAIQQFTTESGLSSDFIHDIMEASDGTIWLAYRRGGISSWRNDRLLNFSHRNGLPNSEVFLLAESEDGGIWGATRNAGLVRYQPDRDPPETFIKASPRELPPNGAGIFSFYGWDAWNHTATEDLLYSWRVNEIGAEEATGEWSTFVSGDAAVVPALAAGHYLFEVRAADGDRNVDPTPAQAAFHVLAPFYTKPSFILPIALLSLLALTAVLMRRRAHQALLASEQTLLVTNRRLTSEIHERREAEKALEHHQTNLEATIQERTQALENAQEKLLRRERLATLGQVTATISHELRNPLGTIKSSLFTLSKRLGDSDPRLTQIVERVDRNINRCSNIIDELLDFTRELRLNRVSTDLNTWCPTVVDDFPLPKGQAITFEPCDRLLHVQVDREHLRRALVNAIQNASQAIEDSDAPEKQIRIRTGVNGVRCYIRCEDTGPGIPADKLERIFEPFFSTRGFGVGLGVPIMQGILHGHGGEVTFDSNEGGGTTVTLWIPLASPPPEA